MVEDEITLYLMEFLEFLLDIKTKNGVIAIIADDPEQLIKEFRQQNKKDWVRSMSIDEFSEVK